MESMVQRNHKENHLIERTGWLRAAVLGANDGIISTASLILGVISAGGRHQALVAGVAGLVAGAMAMAAGEYVSVSSQADTEQAAMDKEREELASRPDLEEVELAQIYSGRGVAPELAREVARQLMLHDPLAAHARDELGISGNGGDANPIQAAVASALTFSLGAAAPLVIAFVSPEAVVMPAIGLGALLFLAGLGAVGAKAGGAAPFKPALRVAFWGALAMALTTAIGQLFGAAV